MTLAASIPAAFLHGNMLTFGSPDSQQPSLIPLPAFPSPHPLELTPLCLWDLQLLNHFRFSHQSCQYLPHQVWVSCLTILTTFSQTLFIRSPLLFLYLLFSPPSLDQLSRAMELSQGSEFCCLKPGNPTNGPAQNSWILFLTIVLKFIPNQFPSPVFMVSPFSLLVLIILSRLLYHSR